MNIGLINEALIIKSTNDFKTDLYESFIDKISNSDYLINEYNVYNNIKNFNTKDVSKDFLVNFIKENIDILKSYDKKTISNERKKLNYLNNLPLKENVLLSAISTIIEESVIKPKNKSDINIIYKNYDVIFEELNKKQNKNIVEEVSSLNEKITIDEVDFIISNAQKSLKEKYDSLLSEEEQKVLKIVINGSTNDKKLLFENLKTKALKNIEDNKNEITEQIYKSSISKINSMSTNDDSILEESIINLIKIIY